jgi:hypothetical protein
MRLLLSGLILVLLAGLTLAQTSPPSPSPVMPTGIEGVITVSPVQGGPIRMGVPSSRPLAATEFVVANETGAVGSFTTDEHGHFRVMLRPGHYTVTKKNAAHGIGRYGPFDAYVQAGEMTKVEWNCDSGMR